VAKVLNRRFDPDAGDRALVVLARGGLPLDEWKPILLWHITRDEFLLRDFLENWLFSAYDAGAYRANPEGTPRLPALDSRPGRDDRARMDGGHAQARAPPACSDGHRLRPCCATSV
jgi:hypothetical protein